MLVTVVKLKVLFAAQLEEWDRMMLINVRGVMLCYKYAAMQMIKQGRGGRIIGKTVHNFVVHSLICSS